MALPSCGCVSGVPFDRLSDIFCALSQIDLECETPTVVSASINGDVLTVVFSERVTGTDGFSISIEGATPSLSYTSGEGTSTYVFTVSDPAEPGDAVFLSYSPGDVAQRECPLELIEEFPVTNNTGLQFVYRRPGGVDSYFRPGGVDTYIRP